MSNVKKFVVNTDNLTGDTMSQSEKDEEQMQNTVNHSTTVMAVEKNDKESVHDQPTSGEIFLPPDIYITGLENEENASLFKRKSILFSENHNQYGSLDGPSLPSSPSPGSLISPCMINSQSISSPRYSWLFSPSSTDGIDVSNINVDLPEFPLSSPPGKPLSPRTSTAFINADQLNLIPGPNMPLSTLLRQLPLAEIFTHESDEPNEGSVNESETNCIENEKQSVDSTNRNTVTLPSESDLGKGNTDQTLPKDVTSHVTSDHLPRLEPRDNTDNGLYTKDEHNIKQLTESSSLADNMASGVHPAIESFVKSSTFTGSSGYNSDPVQSLSYFQSSKRRESSSTAPTEISNTSDEPHVANLCKSNSGNSLVCTCVCLCSTCI